MNAVALAKEAGLPCAPGHEIELLTTALRTDASTLERILALVDETDFYGTANRTLFREIKAVHAAGRLVNAVSVGQSLMDHGRMESVGGLSRYLDSDHELPPGADIIERVAGVLREQTIRRQALLESDRLRNLALNGGTSEDLLIALQAGMEKLGSRQKSASTLLPLLEIYKRDFRANWDEFTGKLAKPEIPMPFQTVLGGLRRGELTILAARPGEGKSSLANNLAVYAAKKGVRVFIWSLEMRSGSLLRRMLASEAKISQYRLMRGWLREAESKQAYASMGPLCDLPILIQDRHSGVGVEQIRRTLRSAAASGEMPGLLVVDYLQLMEGVGKNRNEQVGYISRGLKGLTLDFDVSVLALSQLSRDQEKQGKREPILSDLRDSGSLEQDADNVVFLYCPSEAADQDARPVRFIVRKQRSGETGATELVFVRSQLRFEAAA